MPGLMFGGRGVKNMEKLNKIRFFKAFLVRPSVPGGPAGSVRPVPKIDQGLDFLNVIPRKSGKNVGKSRTNTENLGDPGSNFLI